MAQLSKNQCCWCNYPKGCSCTKKGKDECNCNLCGCVFPPGTCDICGKSYRCKCRRGHCTCPGSCTCNLDTLLENLTTDQKSLETKIAREFYQRKTVPDERILSSACLHGAHALAEHILSQKLCMSPRRLEPTLRNMKHGPFYDRVVLAHLSDLKTTEQLLVQLIVGQMVSQETRQTLLRKLFRDSLIEFLMNSKGFVPRKPVVKKSLCTIRPLTEREQVFVDAYFADVSQVWKCEPEVVAVCVKARKVNLSTLVMEYLIANPKPVNEAMLEILPTIKRMIEVEKFTLSHVPAMMLREARVPREKLMEVLLFFGEAFQLFFTSEHFEIFGADLAIFLLQSRKRHMVCDNAYEWILKQDMQVFKTYPAMFFRMCDIAKLAQNNILVKGSEIIHPRYLCYWEILEEAKILHILRARREKLDSLERELWGREQSMLYGTCQVRLVNGLTIPNQVHDWIIVLHRITSGRGFLMILPVDLQMYLLKFFRQYVMKEFV